MIPGTDYNQIAQAISGGMGVEQAMRTYHIAYKSIRRHVRPLVAGFDALMASRMAQARVRGRATIYNPTPLPKLVEAAKLLQMGLSIRKVAIRLHIAPKTIRAKLLSWKPRLLNKRSHKQSVGQLTWRRSARHRRTIQMKQILRQQRTTDIRECSQCGADLLTETRCPKCGSSAIITTTRSMLLEGVLQA